MLLADAHVRQGVTLCQLAFLFHLPIRWEG